MGPCFVHDALLYGSDEEYLAAAVPFLEDGLRAGESVSAVTTEHNAALLRGALGTASDIDLTVQSADDLTPARKIALLQAISDEQPTTASPRGRVLGEATFGATTGEQLDWVRYEAILNAVFASCEQTFLCAYDVRTLPSWVVESAARTHPHLRSGGDRAASTSLENPAELARECGRELVPKASSDDQLVLDIRVDGGMLAAVRGLLESLAREASGSPEQASEITVGLNEVIANALEHGSDSAHVRCWHDGDRLICEVADDGPGLDDPLAGYRPPSPQQLDGRGLWIARQILDVVELQQREDSGLRAHLAVSV